MSRVEEAITWSGSGTVLNFFVVWPRLPTVEPSLSFQTGRPDKLTIFHIEDEFNVLNGLLLSEYDVKFAQPPEDLQVYLISCLQQAVRDGARAAWFGFEASFGFDAFLTKTIADQIYAMADTTGSISLALQDNELRSSAWSSRILRLGEALRTPSRLIRARVLSFASSQVDLLAFVPTRRDDVRIVIRMLVESDDHEGEETFEFTVCTPQNLAKGPDAGPIVGRHLLIVKSWDWPQVRAFLTSTIESEAAPTWERLRGRIERFAKWEYEDFAPADSPVST